MGGTHAIGDPRPSGRGTTFVGRTAEVRTLLGALADRRVHAEVLGPAGMGKTRLLDEVSTRLTAQGRAVERVVASARDLTVPFAPFAHLLDEEAFPAQDPTERMARIMAALSARSDGSDLVLMVDDAHRLDPSSVELLHQVMTLLPVCVAVAARPVPGPDDRLRSAVRAVGGPLVSIEPFDAVDCGSLAQEIVGGSVDDRVRAETLRLSGGNPFFAIELLAAGLEVGALCPDDDGTWHLHRCLAVPPRVQDVIAERLRPLDDPQRELLNLLAVTDGVPLSAVTAIPLMGISALEELDLVQVEERPLGPFLSLRHDLYREVLLDGAATRLIRARELAIVALDSVRGTNPQLELLAARLALDLRRADPERFVSSSRVALLCGDPELALAMAQSAVDAGAGTPAAVVAAGALGAIGRLDEALEAFRTLDREQDPGLLARVVTERAMFLLTRCGDPLAALDCLRDGLDRCGPDHDEGIRATLSMVLFFAGQLEDAIVIAEPLLDRPGPFPPNAGPALAGAWSVLGRPGPVLRVWDRVWESITNTPLDQFSFVGLNLVFCRLLALMQLGRAEHGDDPLDAVPVGVRWPGRESWIVQDSMPATQAFLRGHLDAAAHRYDGLGALLHTAPHQIWIMNEAIIAANQAMRGDVPAARRALAWIDTAPPDTLIPFQWWIDRSKVWLAAAQGEVGAAIHRSLELADRHDDELFYLAWSLHDVVRLGAATRVVGRLADLAAHPDATWFTLACAEHAAAAAARDPKALLQASARFEAGGLDLLAMECAAQAATAALALPGFGHEARSRIDRLNILCGTVHTPAMEMPPTLLTDRELEVARLAARGWTNGRIAERLGTSVRTVGNQLQSVYQKLGINSRDGLPQLFPTRLSVVDSEFDAEEDVC